MEELDHLIQALHLRNWYAFAALALTLIVQLIKTAPRLQPLWLKIPDGYRWLLPIASGAVTGFTQAFASGWSLAAALLAAIGGALGISIPAMGLNAFLTESPMKWNGGPGGEPLPKKAAKPPFLPIFMLAWVLGCLVLLAGACRETLPAKYTEKPCDPATIAAMSLDCNVKAYECGESGVEKLDDCPAYKTCFAAYDARKKACTQ